MNKKRIFILAVVVCCLALAAVGTSAYYTISYTTVNVIQMGSLKMGLHDECAGGKPFPEGGISGVLPDMTVEKKVYLENLGNADFYARIKLDNSVNAANGEPLDFEHITLDINTEHWHEQDGYYYYHRALLPGEKTEPLFTQVNFAPEMGNEYKNAHVEVAVTAQAVQSRHNTDDPLTAIGWSEETDGSQDPDKQV